MGRPSTGSLVWTKKGWAARITTTVDGERVRLQRQLETTNKAAAQRKLARLLASDAPAPTEALPPETFAQAAERVNAQRLRDGVRSARDELARLRSYAFAALGPMPVTAVQTAGVNDALDLCKSQGKSRQTVVHLRQALRVVFDALQREGEIAINPVDNAAMPRFSAVVRKERAVLTDDELVTYLGYEHPLKQHRMPVLERQTMACVARCFGGLRTGDLHTLTWEAFDVAEGSFEWGYAPRRKTKRPQRLEVPAILRSILRDWWERHGKPIAGPVFPSRRGKRVGKVKGKVSHALALRRDLRRAFGVDRWDAESGTFKTIRPLTRRELELFEETDYTLPVDFHSWRRAFTQALADADVNAQTSSALAGHASLAAHARYLASSNKLRRVPESALPGLLPSPTPKVVEAPAIASLPPRQAAESLGEFRGRARDRTEDIRLVKPDSGESDARPGVFSAWPLDLEDQGGGQNRSERQKSTPKPEQPLLDASLADALLGVALRGLAHRAALSLRSGPAVLPC